MTIDILFKKTYQKNQTPHQPKHEKTNPFLTTQPKSFCSKHRRENQGFDSRT